MKLDTGEWRENTAKESMREIRKHIVAELGEVRFEELTAALLRALLKKKAEQGLGRQMLNHLADLSHRHLQVRDSRRLSDEQCRRRAEGAGESVKAGALNWSPL